MYTIWFFFQNIVKNNALLLPSFKISPSYFTVTKGGVIDVNIKFMPVAFGFHTAKLYVLCDNCSFRELDLTGDGFYYEDYFLTVEVFNYSFFNKLYNRNWWINEFE